jgi:hypothetical protein
MASVDCLEIGPMGIWGGGVATPIGSKIGALTRLSASSAARSFTHSLRFFFCARVPAEVK